MFLFAALLTRSAFALDYAEPGEYAVLPADGSLQVPTNSLIWIGADNLDDDEVLTLETELETIQLVEGAEVLTAQGSMVVYDPGSLIVGATYSIVVDGGTAGPRTLAQFGVGDVEDHEPPDAPEVQVDEVVELDDWGFSGVTFSWESAEALTVVDLDGTASLDETYPAGSVQAVTSHGSARLGSGDGCTESWPEAEPGAYGEFRFGAYDLAGNFSGWGEPLFAELGGDGQLWRCGTMCSSAGTFSASGLTMSLVALMLGWRRRR